MAFTHLHLHTHYSFLRGLGKPAAFVKKAKELGMTALAVTDGGNLHAAYEFYSACKKEGIQPIVGLEVSVTSDSMETRNRNETIYHATLLAKNLDGYRNLVQLVTHSYIDGFYNVPRVDFSLLEKYSSDIIFLSGDNMGEIPQHFVTGKSDDFILDRMAWYEKIYGKDDVYLELQEHPDRKNQNEINEKFIKFSKAYGKKLLATSDIHYISPDDAEAQDLLFCMGDGRALEDPDRPTLIEGKYHLKTEQEMRELHAQAPEAVDMTEEVREKINIEFPSGELLFPNYTLEDEHRKKYEAFLENVKTQPDYEVMNESEWLFRYLCVKGLNDRYNFTLNEDEIDSCVKKMHIDIPDVPIQQMELETLKDLAHQTYTPRKKELIEGFSEKQKEVIDRLEYELIVVHLMGFETYFIIVSDFIIWAKEQNIPVGPGRGSAAGALIAYVAKITDIDPLRYGLLFERFLNPARVSMPDIDVDFSDEGRGAVIEYVRKKYGHDHVAQICTFGTMAARAAVKDVGRALGLPFSMMNEIAKLMPSRPGISIQESLEESMEFNDVYKKDERITKVVNNAKRLEGTVRQLGVHACAVIIASEPMTQYCPIQYPPKDKNWFVTQFSAHPLEDIGLLKMDFLGLRNLTIIDRCLRIIKENHNKEIDLLKIDYEDQKVFSIFSNGDTTGVFQFESSGMRKYLKELKPNNFEDIIVMVSLYRPGPLQYIPTYIKRKHGKEKVSFPHKSLEEILALTQGIAVYQEQIMQIVQAFAGFSLGEADILRRAIGKKKVDLLMEQKEKFFLASEKLGHPQKLAKYIFEDVIEPFAGYGFNKSHAACYSMIAYQTAYLKAYYPTEFITALMVSDEEDMDRVTLEINEAREKGIQILPPDVNESRKHFTFIDDKSIRFGLKAIKGLGDGPIKKIIKWREQKLYETIVDFIENTGSEVINKKSLEALILSGAMDRFGERASLIASVFKIIEYNKELQEKKKTNQIGLFDTITSGNVTFELEEAEPFNFSKKIQAEQEVVWYMVSGNPLDGLDLYVQKRSVGLDKIQKMLDSFTETSDVEEVPGEKKSSGKKDKRKEQVKIYAYIFDVRKIQTKTGKMMAIITGESSFFRFQWVIFPRDYDKVIKKIESGKIAYIVGSLQAKKDDYQEISIAIESVSCADITYVRDRAREMGVFGKKAENTLEKEKKTLEKKDDIEIPESEVILEEPIAEVTRFIYTPRDGEISLLHDFKKILLEQESGDLIVQVFFQEKIIDTKFKIQSSTELKKWIEEKNKGTWEEK